MTTPEPYEEVRLYRPGYCQVAACPNETVAPTYMLCPACDRAMAYWDLPGEYDADHGSVLGRFVLRCEELTTIWGRTPW